MRKEYLVKRQVKAILKSLDCYWIMPQGTGFGNSGAADFYGCYEGKCFAIECKSQGAKPTALQMSHLMRVMANGGKALVVDESNINTLRDWIVS